MQTRFLTGLLLALVVFLAVPALAQDTGIISGRVQDPSGAVVSGAQVSIVNIATNIDTPSQTNDEGLYRVPALRPGAYRVTITAAGFKKFVRDSVDLRVGATLPVNANLEVGATSDTVEVSAVTPLLETETSSTGTVMEGDFFYRMPMYQRNAKSVMYLTPGVQVSGFGYSGGLGGFQINGESSGRIGFFEDGMYGVAPATSGTGSGYTTDTIQNTIDEVKILTTALPAEYGHSAGGAITVVKKSGTNELHGLVSDFGRYGGLQHRRFMEKYKMSQPRPAEGLPNGESSLFMQPDANVSGPIYLPKIYDGRNKTFFLFAVQRLIEKQGKGAAADVPTAGELNGDFSYPERPAGAPTPNVIYDPTTTALNGTTWSRQPFAGNIIPKAQWSTAAKNFLAMNPWAPANTGGDWSSTGPSNNFTYSPQKRVFWENYSIRLDHQLSSKLKMFANWTYNSRFERTPNTYIINSALDSTLNKSMNYQNTAGIGGTYIISPTLISETKMNYYRYENRVSSIAYGIDWGAKLGIPNIGNQSMPAGLPLAVGNPSYNVQETFGFREDVSKMMGKHAFKMGYDLLRIRLNSVTIANDAGNISFANTNGISANGSSITNTGFANPNTTPATSSLPNFMVGAVSSYSVSYNALSVLPRDWIHSFYFQDDWKIAPNVTANIGVRYMVESPPTNKYGQQSRFNPTAPDNSVAGAIGVIEHPTGSMYNKDWNNFQPRFGLAWHARQNIVVRTGYSLSTVDNRAQAPPTDEFGSVTATINQPSGEFRPKFMIDAGVPLPIPWPALRADGSSPFSGSNYSGRGATWVNPDRVNPYSMNWNFGVQYGLSSNYLVEVTYTGNRSLKGTESWSMNNLPYDWAWNLLQTNPAEFTKFEGNSQPYRYWTNFGGISFQGQGARSNFNAGTIKLEKRYSRGLSFLAYYTYAKSIESSTGSMFLDRSVDRSRSGFDRTHVLNTSMNYELPIGKGRKLLNRGGVLNTLFGGYDMVWTYQISSGNPQTLSFSNATPKYMPGVVTVRSNSRFTSTGTPLSLRDNWQDIGGDRFTQSNQNRMIGAAGVFPMDTYFIVPAAYTQGNMGQRTMDNQRFIAATFSASKSFKIKERYTVQLRYDFQNPFKWYNLASPNTTVNLSNINKTGDTFGKVNATASGESSTAGNGGVPIQNLTVAFRW